MPGSFSTPVVILGAAMVALSGCGGSPRAAAPADPGTTSGVTTSLRVRVIPDGGAATGGRTYTLACGRTASGTLPDPEGACSRIAASPSVLTAGPVAGEVCTDIYGGPQVIGVSGTLGGTPAAARFGRANGCEIARYDAVVRVLFGDAPPAGVATGTTGRPLSP